MPYGQMDSYIDLDLLDRYLAGLCSMDERKVVEEWLAAHPARSLAGLTESDRHYPPGLGDSAATWSRVQAAVAAESKHGVNGPARSPKWYGRFSRHSIARIAVGFCALAGIGIAGWTVATNRLGAARGDSSIPSRTYTTRPGERATVTLADGSRVQLAPATRVTMHSGSDGDMAVNVIGEAMFTVVHRANSVFRVRTSNAEVRVLGTEFVVRRYADDRTARVLVRDGRVMLRSFRGERTVMQGAVLAGRMLGVVDDSGGVQVTPDIGVDEYSSLVAGRLVFRKTTILDVVAELNRAYGAEIRVADSTLARATVSWNCVVANQSVEHALRELVLLVDAHYVQSGHDITILPGPSASSRRSIPPLSLTPERQYGR